MNHRPLVEDLAHELASLALELRSVQEKVENAITLLSQSAQPTQKSSRKNLHELLSLHKDELPELILEAIEGRTVRTPKNFSLRFDPDERAAMIGRRRIPLSDSEFKIFELLWRATPQPVSRRMILDCLYFDKDEPSETVTDVFIYNIRQKLKNAGCLDASIIGVRGLGWALSFDRNLRPDLNHQNENVRAPEPMNLP